MATDQSSRGVELLKIPGVVATQVYHSETVGLGSGELQALLVSIELQEAAKQKASLGSAEKQPDYSTDLWLVLSIGDLSLPVAATQTIVPQRGQSQNSYIFPSLELEGASIKITLPASTSQTELARFEQILSQYAAYQDDDRVDAGSIELMDEDGKVLGVLQGNFAVHEADSMSDSGNEKAPVLIDLPPEPSMESERQDLQVDVLSADEMRDWMIKGADMISRSIIKTSEFVGGKIQGAADSYVAKTPAAGSSGYSTRTNKKGEAGRDAVKVGPKTQQSIQNLHRWSGQAVQVSAKTTGAILRVAGDVGDKIGKKTGIQRKVNPDGTYGPPPTGIKGFINRSLIAANTVLDGVDAGVQTLLYTSGEAASSVVGHKYGDDARQVADGIGRTSKNVFIVYKDVRGVRRSALLKAARSRVIKAKLDDGREVTIKVDEKGNAVASAVSPPATSTAASSSQVEASPASEKSSFAAGLPSANQSSSSKPPSYSTSSNTLESLPPPPSHPSIRRSPSPNTKN
ncbi:hypothetical protein NDA11_002113 [Ustilago hordei]|uniref:Senescence domain-containing protein n=1 Tax=Ustilago hordei TaxID=120017 RepID=I2FW25_USTHO|nr:uncharacterized protein UHO2_00542 [Ustilago hordei]KAJ1041596.1 hypothetical protein NDA10_004188 [Ustilago hordei]KAJ1570630.1 hypothetical protein NDA11_002113 [Ustilago hordei]KAJ1586958.1 hypothetical protein NDA15_000444 [Ustilago hordei]KAJ1589722.1 hypothetical protein NDA12_000261 [Ustilago hordei]KAJ1601997.1 hypothetical protein NDA14_000511 [Ustilago hordei]